MGRHIHTAGQDRHIQGWKKQRPDHRDTHYAIARVSAPEAARLPAVNINILALYDRVVGIYNQGSVGDCTGHGAHVEPIRYLYAKAGKTAPDFSRLFPYAMTRMMEGTPLTEDSGCAIRDVIKAGVRYGACPEALWPTPDDSRFTIEPSAEAKRAALDHQVLSYHAVGDLLTLKSQINAGNPVSLGFSCYESLESAQVAKTGIIPFPTPHESAIGGHCVLAIGYDDTISVGGGQHGAVLIANSWGRGWGNAAGHQGYGWLPYRYFTNGLADDFWVTLRQEGL